MLAKRAVKQLPAQDEKGRFPPYSCLDQSLRLPE